jgi:hypothetical protein
MDIHPGIKFVPPGHFYSPLPSIEEVRRNEEKIFHRVPDKIPGIDLNEEGQLSLFNEFKEYYRQQPFKAKKQKNLRYFFDNLAYPHGDAIFLYCFIRHLRPKRIIEVGSGFSSCVTLDTNEIFFGNSISCTFIDPYPQSLLSLIKEEDKKTIKIIPRNLQDIDISLFSELAENDILFIDSTHVSKINSDVNFIFFEVLPMLRKGVHIHFHDICYPFEYPKEWIYQGIAWNENYFLRAFLQYNNAFSIRFFTTYMYHFHHNLLQNEMPLCMINFGGSMWIRKDVA